MPQIEIIVGLLVAVAALATLAARIKVPYPILLVIGGSVLGLPSVDEWRGYRVGGLAGADVGPPYQYIVAVEINDLGQLGKDMESEQVQTLLAELGRYAEVTQLMTERFV